MEMWSRSCRRPSRRCDLLGYARPRMRLRLFRAALFVSAFAISPSARAGRGAAAPASRRPVITDADGNVVEWQSSAEVVIDLYPATDSVFAGGSQKLFWHAADRAKNYHVQLSTDGDYRNNLIDRTTSDLSVMTGALRPGRYYWHVQAIDGLGTPAAWSTTNDFEIRGGENGAKATLHWRPPTWTSSQFVVRIARDAKMTSIAEQKSTENA